MEKNPESARAKKCAAAVGFLAIQRWLGRLISYKDLIGNRTGTEKKHDWMAERRGFEPRSPFWGETD
jgi:hypothetical protein